MKDRINNQLLDNINRTFYQPRLLLASKIRKLLKVYKHHYQYKYQSGFPGLLQQPEDLVLNASF
jgi:hypothetical protein